MTSLAEIKSKLEPVFEKYNSQLLFGYCFGSLASGQITKKSDIDLAFYVQPENVNLDFQLSLLADCSRILKRNDIDIVILNSLKNLILAEEIIRKGTLLFDFLEKIRTDYELKILHAAIDFRYQRKMIMGF